MKISFKIHANCSEWDEEVFADGYFSDWVPIKDERVQEAIKEANKKGWDQ
jgi:hypothetical protein